MEQETEIELLHEGNECAYCGKLIACEDDGDSTPEGSMHCWCALKHERENPDNW